MTNHVHLLVTPETERSVSSMMQSVGRSYVRHVNATYRRSGTLWEGRPKSALIDSERYLLVCSRYIELNPVRAGIVERPDEYRWSSYARNCMAWPDGLVSPHEIYQRLGHSDEERQAAYKALFVADVDAENETAQIRHATAQGVVLGNERFREEIEATLGRRVSKDEHGGDRKSRAFRERYQAGTSSSTLTP